MTATLEPLASRTSTGTVPTEPISPPAPSHRIVVAPDPAHAALLEPFSIVEMVDRVRDTAVEKAAHPASMFVRALIGGVMVAFGVLLSVTVSAGITVPGVASLVMGLAFGFSFVLILVSNVSLITADMAAGMIAVLDRRLSVPSYLRFLALGLVGNLLGALAFISVAAAAGGPYLSPALAANITRVGVTKSGADNLTSLLLAVLCTWFLQTAMFLYFKARTDVARMGFAFYGPFAFVIGGTQHVIANIAFIAFPLLLGGFHPGALPHHAITWGWGGHGLLRNLVMTTMGNFVGGAMLVAVPFYTVARLMQRRR